MSSRQEEKAADGSRPVLLHTVDSEEVDRRSGAPLSSRPATAVAAAAGATSSPRGRPASVEMMPPATPAAVKVQDENEPLSEDEEEQIKLEAQIGMLLTAARSG